MNKTVLVAPMMDCTDRHDRYFLRLISKNIKLYTEMIVANAIIKGNKDFHLKFNLFEKPLALQLGGSNPTELAHATKIAKKDEIKEAQKLHPMVLETYPLNQQTKKSKVLQES